MLSNLEVHEKMQEILADRARLRRESEERVAAGMKPFPTKEEIEYAKFSDRDKE